MENIIQGGNQYDFNRQIETPTESQNTANKKIFSTIINENQ